MSTVTEIERAIEQLAPQELARLRAWFAEFDAQRWDRQFEEDAVAGRLDRLADEARAEGGCLLTRHREHSGHRAAG